MLTGLARLLPNILSRASAMCSAVTIWSILRACLEQSCSTFGWRQLWDGHLFKRLDPGFLAPGLDMASWPAEGRGISRPMRAAATMQTVPSRRCRNSRLPSAGTTSTSLSRQPARSLRFSTQPGKLLAGEHDCRGLQSLAHPGRAPAPPYLRRLSHAASATFAGCACTLCDAA